MNVTIIGVRVGVSGNEEKLILAHSELKLSEGCPGKQVEGIVTNLGLEVK